MPENTAPSTVGHTWIERFRPLEIRRYPDPVLRTETAVVPSLTDPLRLLANRMAATMYAERGVGLAAPQVGETVRLIVVDAWQDGRPPVIAFNPELVTWNGYWKGEEGCLSIPGFHADVERAASVVVRYRDAEWNEREESWSEFASVVFQHEIDLLDGILFTDRISKLKRQLFLKEFGLEKRPFRRPPSLAQR